MSESPPRSRFPLGLDSLQSRGAGAAGAPGRRSAPATVAERPRTEAPRGHGLDSERVRQRMVERLQAEGLTCPPVLQALATVPRHHFVDTALATQAYEDTSLPIGLGQTISKPSVVARMLSLLHGSELARRHGGLGRVLEIGTGCGYQTALLALMATRVVSIERLKALHDKAADKLADRRSDQRIRLVWGDGCDGHAPLAPFDHIVAAAGGDELPAAWLDQLAQGGRLVAPMRDPATGRQSLLVVDRDAQGLRRQRHEAVLFVPLKSGLA